MAVGGVVGLRGGGTGRAGDVGCGFKSMCVTAAGSGSRIRASIFYSEGMVHFLMDGWFGDMYVEGEGLSAKGHGLSCIAIMFISIFYCSNQ